MSYGMLASGVIAWFVAGLLKVPIHYFVKHQVDWGLIFSTGGMPSSHSALVTGTTLAIGLFTGFDTPAFAIAFALSMVVAYDAAGVRRQAGMHAQRINMILNEFFLGHPISEQQLQEVLGHSPFEVAMGVVVGLIVALVTWMLWPK
jgi:uncharacterized protein